MFAAVARLLLLLIPDTPLEIRTVRQPREIPDAAHRLSQVIFQRLITDLQDPIRGDVPAAHELLEPLIEGDVVAITMREVLLDAGIGEPGAPKIVVQDGAVQRKMGGDGLQRRPHEVDDLRIGKGLEQGLEAEERKIDLGDYLAPAGRVDLPLEAALQEFHRLPLVRLLVVKHELRIPPLPESEGHVEGHELRVQDVREEDFLLLDDRLQRRIEQVQRCCLAVTPRLPPHEPLERSRIDPHRKQGAQQPGALEEGARRERGVEDLPVLEDGELLRLGQQGMKKRRPAARVTDDEDRVLDLGAPVFREEEVVEKEGNRDVAQSCGDLQEKIEEPSGPAEPEGAQAGTQDPKVHAAAVGEEQAAAKHVSPHRLRPPPPPPRRAFHAASRLLKEPSRAPPAHGRTRGASTIRLSWPPITAVTDPARSFRPGGEARYHGGEGLCSEGDGAFRSNAWPGAVVWGTGPAGEMVCYGAVS
jgi:hypothetical protein